MQQDKSNCPRHPENIITHICVLNQCSFRHLCKQCLEESHLHHHQALDQELLLGKFENKINKWKFQHSLEAKFNYKNSNIRHFKQVIDKICQQIIKFNKYIKEEMKNQKTYELYEMEQELLKLKSGNLCDIKYDKLIFGNDLDDINIDFASLKEKFKPISFDIGQANQLLELLITDNHDIQPKKMNEEIFYQNCQKMVEQIEYIQYNYYSIKDSFLFQNSPDIESFITGCFTASNGNGDDNTQQGTEQLLTGIVVSMYLICKEMKLDLEVNDLFELLSDSSDPDWVSNVIEYILDYKEQK